MTSHSHATVYTAHKVTDEPARDLAWTPSGLLVLSDDGQLLLYHSQGQAEHITSLPPTHTRLTDPCNNLILAYMGQRLQALAINGSLQWETALPDEATTASWQPECRLVAVGTRSGSLIVYDGDGNLAWARGGLKGRINQLEWSTDGRYLSSAGWFNTLHVYDTDGALVYREDMDKTIMTVSWKNNVLAAGVGDTIEFHDMARPNRKTLYMKGLVESIHWNPHTWLIAAAGWYGGVEVIDYVQVTRATYRLPGHIISQARWSPDGESIAALEWPRNLYIIQHETRQIHHIHSLGSIRAIKWHPANLILAAATNTGVYTIIPRRKEEETRREEGTRPE